MIKKVDVCVKKGDLIFFFRFKHRYEEKLKGKYNGWRSFAALCTFSFWNSRYAWTWWMCYWSLCITHVCTKNTTKKIFVYTLHHFPSISLVIAISVICHIPCCRWTANFCSCSQQLLFVSDRLFWFLKLRMKLVNLFFSSLLLLYFGFFPQCFYPCLSVICGQCANCYIMWGVSQSYGGFQH